MAESLSFFALVVALAAAPAVADRVRRALDCQDTDAQGFDLRARAILTQSIARRVWHEVMKGDLERLEEELPGDLLLEYKRLLDLAEPCVGRMKAPIKAITKHARKRKPRRMLYYAFSPSVRSAYERLEREMKSLHDVNQAMDAIARIPVARSGSATLIDSATPATTVPSLAVPSGSSSAKLSDNSSHSTASTEQMLHPLLPDCDHHLQAPHVEEVKDRSSALSRITDNVARAAEVAGGKATATLSKPEQVALGAGTILSVAAVGAANATIAGLNMTTAKRTLELAQQDEQRKIDDDSRKTTDESRKAALHPFELRKAEAEAAKAEHEAQKLTLGDVADGGPGAGPINGTDVDSRPQPTTQTEALYNAHGSTNNDDAITERLAALEETINRLPTTVQQFLAHQLQSCCRPRHTNGFAETTGPARAPAENTAQVLNETAGPAVVSWRDFDINTDVEDSHQFQGPQSINQTELTVSDSALGLMEEDRPRRDKGKRRAVDSGHPPSTSGSIDRPHNQSYNAIHVLDETSELDTETEERLVDPHFPNDLLSDAGAHVRETEATLDDITASLERLNRAYDSSNSSEIWCSALEWPEQSLDDASPEVTPESEASPPSPDSTGREQISSRIPAPYEEMKSSWNAGVESIPLADLGPSEKHVDVHVH